MQLYFGSGVIALLGNTTYSSSHEPAFIRKLKLRIDVAALVVKTLSVLTLICKVGGAQRGGGSSYDIHTAVNSQ